MKKVINLKEILIVLISVLLITASTAVFAMDPLVLGGNNNVSTIPANEYDNAQIAPEDKNAIDNTNNTSNKNDISNLSNTNTSNNTNSVKKYNTNNTTDLPQTGIEDYNVGILLIICVASAIYAYRKVNDYRNI